jgi:hypothetical protein
VFLLGDVMVARLTVFGPMRLSEKLLSFLGFDFGSLLPA